MFKPHHIILIFFLCFSFLAYAQKEKTDSLELALVKAETDPLKVKLLVELSGLYNTSDRDKALQYAKEALALSEKTEYAKGMSIAHNALGSTYFFLNDYDSALFCYKQSLQLAEKLNLKKNIAKNTDNIGLVYMEQGDYPKALDHFLKALKINEELGNKRGIAQQLNNISSVYGYQNNHTKSLEYLMQALTISEELNNDALLSSVLANIGTEHYFMNEKEKAVYYFQLALNVTKKMSDMSTSAMLMSNISVCYQNQQRYAEALDYLNQCVKIQEKLNDKRGLAVTYGNIGSINQSLKNYAEAIPMFQKSLSIANEIGSNEIISNAQKNFSDLYYEMGNYRKAYDYYQLHAQTKDSLLNESNTRATAEMQTKYETEKKENQIEIQHLQISKKDLELNQKQLTVYAAVGGIMLALLLAFFAYRGYRLKQKSNKLLEEKNILIEAQKKLVEERNRDITDSITYAKRIQEAILPEKQKILEALPESFILYMPKDIVSGDFYWHTQIENGQALIAAADCTGHGVPGAFMSMIGSNTLTKIVAEKNITQPAEILNHLNSEIKTSLKQKSDYNSSKDGMDIALCSLEFGVRSSETNLPTPDSSLTTKLQYAGANRPLIYFENAEMKEIVPDKTAIGGFTDDCYMFINHTLELQKGTMIYIFSDGYADQFGGPRGKKFMLKNFKELLKTIKNFPVAEQEKTLREVHLAWKGNVEQVDDVLVIGIRV